MAQNAPPLIVTCVITGAEAWVTLQPANHPLIILTACLNWDPTTPGPNNIARVRLLSWQMLKAFGCRLTGSKAQADLPATRSITPLTLCLTGGAWARILNEYVASGILRLTVQSREDVIAGVRSLTITTPANLLMCAGDWLPGEATILVAAVAGHPGQAARGRRGRGGAVPPVAAVLGRPALDAALGFLDLTSVPDLEISGDAPWAVICYLAGLLGSCLSQAERNRLGSQAQLSARMLSAGCAARYSIQANDPYSLAASIRDFIDVLRAALPVVMLSAGLDPVELRIEGRDAITYVRDDTGRRQVEESRVLSFGSTCAAPARSPPPPWRPARASPKLWRVLRAHATAGQPGRAFRSTPAVLHGELDLRASVPPRVGPAIRTPSQPCVLHPEPRGACEPSQPAQARAWWAADLRSALPPRAGGTRGGQRTCVPLSRRVLGTPWSLPPRGWYHRPACRLNAWTARLGRVGLVHASAGLPPGMPVCGSISLGRARRPMASASHRILRRPRFVPVEPGRGARG